MKFTNTLLSFNRLEFKIAVALFIITCTSLIFSSIIVNHSVLVNLAVIEKEEVRKTAVAVSREPFYMARNIERIIKDYSIRDDAYKSVSDNDMEWIYENFIQWITNNYEVDLVLVADSEKRILGSYGMDQVQLFKLLENNLNNKLTNETCDKNTKFPFGVIDINNELYVFSAQSIAPSSAEGLPAGIMLLGKKIDSKVVRRIEADTGEVAFITYRSSLIRGNEQETNINKWLQNYSKNHEGNDVKVLDKTTIMSQKYIYDYEGNKVAKIYVVKDRNMFRAVTKSIWTSICIGILVSLAIVGLLLIPLKRFIMIPIKSFQNQISNVRNVDNKQGFDIEGLNAFINLTTIFNEIAISLNMHKEENSDLKRLSINDALTALYNERYFHEYFNTKVLNSSRLISAIFCDIDNFSLINQIYGYNIGDLLLIRVAGTIREELDARGVAFKIGNDSFLLLLEGVCKTEAVKYAEKIRFKVHNSSFSGEEIKNVSISMSFGIVSYPEDLSEMSMLIEKAEAALNCAKNNGGNQYKCYISSMDSFSELDREEYIKRKMQFNSVLALAFAIDAKDNYTGSHSQSVAKYVLDLAEKLEMSEKEKDDLRMGALLHDCGKIGIPDNIMGKADKLSTEEWNMIRRHPLLGYDIVKCAIDNPHILSCIRNHHERWDGKGYPDGLSKLNIPYYARIVCIADAYHAMFSDRAYRPGLSKEAAISELRKGAGVQFDPALVELFIEVISGY